MAQIDGATLVARSLKQQGVDAVFGIVGVPVTPIAQACQREGIGYYGMRHESAAGYAAQAYSYCTGRLGVALVVSGPGSINAIPALANAWSNCWPMLLIGGSAEIARHGMGDFQEAPQVEAARTFVKWAHQAEHAQRIPFYVESALRSALRGRPGPAYLDLPGDVISAQVEEGDVRWYPPVTVPRPQADPADIERALQALRTAQRPLVIVGKGTAWARAEHEVREFIERTQLPFLPTPMGKGVVPDDHPLIAASARTFALRNADLIMLLGARLNWILHFGLPPRFSPDVRAIQLDIAGEEIGANVPAEVGLVGDAKAVLGQLNAALREEPWEFDQESPWRAALREESAKNRANIEPMLNDDGVPMNYYRALREIADALPRDAVIVSEGASTMDIGRQVLPNYEPRTRLDAGSFGTMGVGPGFAVAAAVAHPDRRVVAVEGDSAIGFDGMDMEVAVRYRLPITWVVFVNNGIGGAEWDPAADAPVPVNALTPGIHYERVLEAFGGQGFHAETPQELREALRKALASDRSCLINVPIDPQARRRPQQYHWLTR